MADRDTQEGASGPFAGRFVVLHDLDTADFLPLGVLFEESDGSATLRVFEDAEARDPHLSKLRREFDDFEEAVSSWSRSALISTFSRIGASDVTV